MPYNPWAAWPITGTWADHASYSLGGEDYPLPYGTPLLAPAAGTLRTVGGAGEFKAGQVGSAGRRSILELDRPIRDVVAVVVQHQSEYGDNGRHFGEGEAAIGWSGASANGSDWGGDVHLHVHCLTAGGSRRKFTDYFTTASYPSGGGAITPIPPAPSSISNHFTLGDEDMAEPIYAKGNVNAAVYALYVTAGANNDSADLQGNVYAARRKVEAGEWAIVNAIGFPHPKQKKLAVIPQADFDKIPKVFGSN